MNHKTKVFVETGGAEIIASGVGMTFSPDATFDIHLSIGGDFDFTVSIQFEDEIDMNQPRMKTTVNAEESLITLTCMNFTDFIGTGTLKPLKLGVYNERQIFMKFWVMTPEEKSTRKEKSTREIRYCFYLKKDDTE